MANAAPRPRQRPFVGNAKTFASALRKAITVLHMPRNRHLAKPPPNVPRRPPRVRDLSAEIRHLERDIALHPYSGSTPRQEPAMTRYCGVQARAPKEKKRARKSRKNKGPVPLMEPEGSAPLMEPKGPAPLVEPSGPAPLIEPSGPAPLVEPSGPAPLAEPSGPAPLIESEGPALAEPEGADPEVVDLTKEIIDLTEEVIDLTEEV
ncbi:hypothetical protein BJY52DRAFT_1200784 [Lactarius psammicola]|nr:hypothetical protein BJY52DRAFT_1200784 [Lactarius psammicola]